MQPGNTKGEIWLVNHDDAKKIVVSHINVRQSIVFLMLKLVILDSIATLFALLFFSPFLFPVSSDIRTQILTYNVWYFFILVTAKVLLTLFLVLQWLNEYFEITPMKIYHRRGILWRKEATHELATVKSIGIQQGILGRIFNYGTLFFYDREKFKYFYLHYIHNPFRYLDVLHNLLPHVEVEKEVIREHIHDDAVS